MQRLELAQTVDDAVDVPVTLKEGGKVEAEKAIYSNIQDGAPGLALRGMQLARLPALLLQASHLVELDTSYNNQSPQSSGDSDLPALAEPRAQPTHRLARRILRPHQLESP